MEYKIEDLPLILNAKVVKKVSPNEIVIKIEDKEHSLHILDFSTNDIEFMLDNSYHYAKFVHVNSADIRLEVDGNQVTVSHYNDLRAIAQKSSGGQSTSSVQRLLTSSIPGRVVSIVAKLETEVKKGDVIIVLESMKMQIAIKAHKDGKVKELKVKEGSSISRNDVVALIE